MKSDASPARPFYTEYAWAFDLLVDRPVRKECAVIAGWFVERGVLPGADILDAGCGTGRHSIELARRGYIVHGVDRSPALIDVASRAGETAPGRVSFAVGDIAALPAAQYAAILCRGVLNDVLEDDRRDAVFSAFGRALLPNGTLVLDVREWHASMKRKTAEPLYRKRVSTDRGELTFTSVTELDVDNRLLLVSERHELVGNGEVRVSDGRFVMRCWEREELDKRLARHGFGNVQYFGAYDIAVPAGATDRLVAVASHDDQRRARGALRVLPGLRKSKTGLPMCVLLSGASTRCAVANDSANGRPHDYCEHLRSRDSGAIEAG